MPKHRGDLVEPRTRARVTQDCWSTLRALGPKHESQGKLVDPVGLQERARASGTAFRARRPSEPNPSQPGQLVDPAGLRTEAPVPRDIWSTPRGLGNGPESPRTAVRPRGLSDIGPSRPGRLFDTPLRPTRAQVPRDSWSTLEDIRHRPESTGRFGRHRGPSGPARVARERLWNPRALGHGPDVPGTAVGPRGTSGTGPSRPVQMVDRRTSDTGPSHAGLLVDPAGPRSRARMAKDIGSTSRALGHKRVLPGTAGQPRGNTDPSVSGQG